MLRLLRDTGLAPRLLHWAQTSRGFCLIYRHIDGHSWRCGVKDVARVLSHLHHLDINPELPLAPSGTAALKRQTRAILARCPSEKAADLWVDDDESCATPETTARRLIHGDVVPNNLIATATSLYLIDWQCPALGDPAEDISTFLSPAMQTLYGGAPLGPADRAEFLDAFADKDAVRRYLALAPWYHRRMAAYCLWKSAQGARDYSAALQLELTALAQSVI